MRSSVLAARTHPDKCLKLLQALRRSDLIKPFEHLMTPELTMQAQTVQQHRQVGHLISIEIVHDDIAGKHRHAIVDVFHVVLSLAGFGLVIEDKLSVAENDIAPVPT